MNHTAEGPIRADGRNRSVRSSGYRFSRPLAVVRDDDSDGREIERAVARAQAGSRDAMRYLYCRYADSVYRYVRSIVGDEHEAEDVTQSAFAKVMTRIGTYEPRGVPFSAWLLRVARNAALDHVRQRRPVPVEVVGDTAERHDGEMTPETGALLHDAMAELTGDQRRVVFLRHVAGLTPSEIASRTGATEAAVHGLHHRGRLALRRALDKRGARPSVQTPRFPTRPEPSTGTPQAQ